MYHPQHEQGRSEESYIEETDLHSFRGAVAPPPPPASTPSHSVYGGLARSEAATSRHDEIYDHDNDHRDSRRPSHDPTHVQPRTPLQAQPLPPTAYFLNPATASSHSISNSTPSYEGGLPAFSRWSPTWVSGGVESEGRAFTHHPPPASYYSPANDRDLGDAPWTRRHREATEEDGEGGWVPEPAFVGEWEAPGGEYRHGVGFEPASSSGPHPPSKVADRLRRLEREFGRPAANTTAAKEGPVSFKERLEAARVQRLKDKNREEEHTGLDKKGRLVVVGVRKRAALRWFQGLGAVGVAFGSIGASLLTHPTATPPPDKTTPLFILYLLPFLSLALTIYLFLIRPCVLRKASRSATPAHLVVPMNGGQRLGGGGGGCCCFGGGRKKGSQNPYCQPTVNLVLDPSMFPHLFGGAHSTTPLTTSTAEAKAKRKRRRRRRAKLAAEKQAARGKDGKGDDDDEDLLSSGQESSSDTDSDSDDDPAHPHLGGHHGHHSAKEQQRWDAARKTVKVFAWWDAAAGLLWGGLAAWAIVMGKHCTPGAFQGWCDYYNSALALAVLLACAFLTSLTLDCLDLRRTKESPALRHRRRTIP
ncbi:hypothetical protein RQP46_004876 [Phenoliferia psychrophenolica]